MAGQTAMQSLRSNCGNGESQAYMAFIYRLGLAALSRTDMAHLTWNKINLQAREIKIFRYKTSICQQPPIDQTLAEHITA